MSICLDIEKKVGGFRLKVKMDVTGKTLAFLGVSGSGKTLLMKCIAGLEKPDSGRIVIDGVTLFDADKGINLRGYNRRVGLLSQERTLCLFKNVQQNIYAGTCRKMNKVERTAKVNWAMETLGLENISKNYPHKLSEGQRQRVALAKVLVSAPSIILADAAFASYLTEIQEVLDNQNVTVMIATAEPEIAYRSAEQLVVLDGGTVQMVGDKKSVFSNPVTKIVAQCTGCENISDIEILEGGEIWATDWDVALKVSAIPEGVTSVGIRAHDLVSEIAENSYRCRVVEVVDNLSTYTVVLEPLQSQTGNHIVWKVGRKQWDRIAAPEIGVNFDPKSLLLLRNVLK